jgi:hypothetical protein
MGAVSIWALGLGLSCLLGLIVGIAVQAYIFPRVSVFPFIYLYSIQQTIAYTLSN